MAIADTARLIASLELQDKFSQPAGRITGSLTQMESGFSRIGRGAGQVGAGLSRIGTVAAGVAVGGLTTVVKTAIDFESAFSAVRKTVEATPAELDELNEAFRQMARETGIAFTEFSRIGAVAGALNVPTESIDEFALAISKASVATGLSVDSLADSTGRLGTILKLDASTYDTFLSTLVELGNKGASTEAEILEITKRFAATGKQAGLTEAQILGLSSAISSLGVEPEAAGSALSRIMTNFITETANASDKAKTFADVAGVSFKDFAKTVEDDTLGAVLQFVEALGGLDKLERFKLLKEAGITNVRDRNAILLFSDGIGEVNRQLGIAQDEWGKTDALEKEFAERQKTVAQQLNIVKTNLQDVANTIGSELLPVIADASKDFVNFLNQDTTQAGIKDFAEDLRGFFEDLRGADFSGLLDTLKTSAQVAKTAVDVFNALPGPLKAAIIGGVALNRATFGGAGLIAKGLTNILSGTLKLAFPKLDIFGRGSPANPMFTKEVGLGGAVGGGATGGLFGGGKGFLAGAAKVFGIALAGAFAVEVGKEIGNAIIGPQVQPQIDKETGIFEEQLDVSKDSIERLTHMEEALQDGIHGIAGNTIDGLERFLIPGLSTLEAQLAAVREAKDAAIANADTAREQRDIERDALNDAKAGRLADAHNAQTTADALKNLTLEQRLIRDKGFKAKIDSAEFLRLLRQTSEFGAKGTGTAIEVGPRTGRDPLGDAFIALVKRLPKNQLTGEVYREVSNHIIALEEVQSGLIREGKVAAARHAQQNIDKLAALIGTVDRTRPPLERGAESNRQTAVNTASFIGKMERQLGLTAEQTGIQRGLLAKDTTPNVSVNVRSQTSVSVNDVVRAVNTYDYAVNTFGNKLSNIPL